MYAAASTKKWKLVCSFSAFFLLLVLSFEKVGTHRLVEVYPMRWFSNCSVQNKEIVKFSNKMDVLHVSKYMFSEFHITSMWSSTHHI